MTVQIIPIVLSFSLSLIFALGGIGAAVALIPAFLWYGLDFNTVKPIALMVNTLSLTGASISNIKNKRLDFKMAIPIIILSAIFAPIGAFSSQFIPQKIAITIFIIFLLFSASIMLFFRKNKTNNKFRNDKPIKLFSVIGMIAGYISGLLGIGGGSFISPTLILSNFNPKKVTAITAFIVPFSSFIGFISYSIMGTVNWPLLIMCAISGYFGGLAGTYIMHNYINQNIVKKILASTLILVAIKMAYKLI